MKIKAQVELGPMYMSYLQHLQQVTSVIGNRLMEFGYQCQDGTFALHRSARVQLQQDRLSALLTEQDVSDLFANYIETFIEGKHGNALFNVPGNSDPSHDDSERTIRYNGGTVSHTGPHGAFL